MSHIRYAVATPSGWLGASTGGFYTCEDGRYLCRPGYRRVDCLEKARLFLRKADATKAAGHWAGDVRPVQCLLCAPLRGEVVDP